MAHDLRRGDVKLTGTGGLTSAMIYSGSSWEPVPAEISFDNGAMRVAVRVSSDVKPSPTGRLLLLDSDAGWTGFVSVS